MRCLNPQNQKKTGASAHPLPALSLSVSMEPHGSVCRTDEPGTMPYPFVGDIDTTKVSFGPMMTENNRQFVLIHRDNTSTKASNKLVFNLCSDPRSPFACRYRLDVVREDQDGSRRGLIVKIENDACLAALKTLDEHVIAHAKKNSKEFFKKSNMTHEEIMARYKPLVSKAQEDDENYSLKFKVKCKGYPTALHLLNEDKTIEENGATIEDISQPGAKVAPILSAYQLWFMAGGATFGVTIQAEKMVVLPGAPKPFYSDFCSMGPPLEMSNKKMKLSNGDGDAACDHRVEHDDGVEEVVKLEDDGDSPM